MCNKVIQNYEKIFVFFIRKLEFKNACQEDSGEKETGNLTGDVNCDGKVDVTDITVLAVSLVDNVTLDSQAAVNADTDRNGTVHPADLAKLRQYISKQINEL